MRNLGFGNKMKIITQKEAIDLLGKVRYDNENTYCVRWLFKVNELAKKRGYRLMGCFDYFVMIGGEWLAFSYTLSNIEVLCKEKIAETKSQTKKIS